MHCYLHEVSPSFSNSVQFPMIIWEVFRIHKIWTGVQIIKWAMTEKNEGKCTIICMAFSSLMDEYQSIIGIVSLLTLPDTVFTKQTKRIWAIRISCLGHIKQSVDIHLEQRSPTFVAWWPGWGRETGTGLQELMCTTNCLREVELRASVRAGLPLTQVELRACTWAAAAVAHVSRALCMCFSHAAYLCCTLKAIVKCSLLVLIQLANHPLVFMLPKQIWNYV